MTDENMEAAGESGLSEAMFVKIKILVIEDSPPMNLLYDRGLPATIFEKRFAKDGQDGLMIYEDWRPDIIILDVMLPVMTGYSVLKKIRISMKDKSTTIIVSTSLSKKEDVTSMMKLGIQGYIIKPFNIRDIGNRILKYYEKIDSTRAAAALVLHNEFLEELTRAAFKMKAPAENSEDVKGETGALPEAKAEEKEENSQDTSGQ